MRFTGIFMMVMALVSCGVDDEEGDRADLGFLDPPVVTPSHPIDGDSVTVSFVIYNYGIRDAPAFTWSLLRSGTGIITEQAVNGLQWGEASATQSITIEEISGTHSYTVILDPDDRVLEYRDGHANEYSIVVSVAPALFLDG